MYRIVKKETLNPSVNLYEIEAPMTAKTAAGAIVILRSHKDGERIPITIHDCDREKGTVTIIVQTVGAATERLRHMEQGEFLEDFVGPLGPSRGGRREQEGRVIGGGVGCALPILSSKNSTTAVRRYMPLQASGIEIW